MFYKIVEVKAKVLRDGKEVEVTNICKASQILGIHRDTIYSIINGKPSKKARELNIPVNRSLVVSPIIEYIVELDNSFSLFKISCSF